MPYIGVRPVERASMVLTQGTLGTSTNTIKVPGGYTPSNIAVYVNGLRLKTSDYTASDGFNITLNETFASGSEYVIEEFRSFEVADVGVSQVTTSTGTQSVEESLDRRVIYADTIADLKALDTSSLVDGQQVQVREYHSGSGVGGGRFYWDVAHAKLDHDGGAVIDPNKAFPGNWGSAVDVENWYTGTNSGAGCFVLLAEDSVYASQYGAYGVGFDHALGINKALSRFVTVYLLHGAHYLDSPIHLPAGRSLVGAGIDLTKIHASFSGNVIVLGDNSRVDSFTVTAGDGVIPDHVGSVSATDVSEVQISNIKTVGNKHGLLLVRCKSSVIKDCLVESPYRWGVWIEGCSDIEVYRVRALSPRDIGIGSANENFKIAAESAVAAADCHDILLEDCHGVNPYGDSFDVFGIDGYKVYNVNIVRCTATARSLLEIKSDAGNVSQVTVKDCTGVGTAGSLNGITLSGIGGGITIEGGSLTGFEGSGLSAIDDAYGFDCRRVTFESCGLHAVLVSGGLASGSVTLDSCTAYNCGGANDSSGVFHFNRAGTVVARNLKVSSDGVLKAFRSLTVNPLVRHFRYEGVLTEENSPANNPPRIGAEYASSDTPFTAPLGNATGDLIFHANERGVLLLVSAVYRNNSGGSARLRFVSDAGVSSTLSATVLSTTAPAFTPVALSTGATAGAVPKGASVLIDGDGAPALLGCTGFFLPVVDL